MAAKTVKAHPLAWSLSCPDPECDVEIPAPGGSLMWTAEDLMSSDRVIVGSVHSRLQCTGCHAWFNLPAALCVSLRGAN